MQTKIQLDNLYLNGYIQGLDIQQVWSPDNDQIMGRVDCMEIDGEINYATSVSTFSQLDLSALSLTVGKYYDIYMKWNATYGTFDMSLSTAQTDGRYWLRTPPATYRIVGCLYWANDFNATPALLNLDFIGNTRPFLFNWEDQITAVQAISSVSQNRTLLMEIPCGIIRTAKIDVTAYAHAECTFADGYRFWSQLEVADSYTHVGSGQITIAHALQPTATVQDVASRGGNLINLGTTKGVGGPYTRGEIQNIAVAVKNVQYSGVGAWTYCRGSASVAITPA